MKFSCSWKLKAQKVLRASSLLFILLSLSQRHSQGVGAITYHLAYSRQDYVLKTALSLPDHTEIQDYLNKEDGWRKMLVTCEQTQLRKILQHLFLSLCLYHYLEEGKASIYAYCLISQRVAFEIYLPSTDFRICRGGLKYVCLVKPKHLY